LPAGTCGGALAVCEEEAILQAPSFSHPARLLPHHPPLLSAAGSVISVSIICIVVSLREVDGWVLSATPCQPKERKKHHVAVRNMIAASSACASLSPEGVTIGYIALGWFLFLQEQIKDIIHCLTGNAAGTLLTPEP